MKRALTRTAVACAVGTWLAAAALPVETAQRNVIPGIFISQPDGPVELIAYAEPTHGNRLVMVQGTLEDAPVVKPWQTLRILCSIPLWPPTAIVVATGKIFREDNSERRSLSFAVRKFNVYTLELRAVDLERDEAVVRLLRNVRASEDNPAYLFVVVNSDGVSRYYAARLSADAPR